MVPWTVQLLEAKNERQLLFGTDAHSRSKSEYVEDVYGYTYCHCNAFIAKFTYEVNL